MTAETDLPEGPPTIAAALSEARASGLDRLDAQLLLGHLLGRSRTWLLGHDDEPVPAAVRPHWLSLTARRLAGEPLAYLTGEHAFHGLNLQVTAAVLDPRPDTEIVVDWALECLAALAPAASVVDLGTGSGAIALAIKHARPATRVSAVERSPAALEVARRNGARLRLAIDWQAGSWFEPLDGRRFDVIVSNPPYIAADDSHLDALAHEPREALVAGADGLDDLRLIVAQAPHHLAAGGWILLEHGHDQGPAVRRLLSDRGCVDIDRRLDLAGHWRCTGGRWVGSDA